MRASMSTKYPFGRFVLNRIYCGSTTESRFS
uniref:Uncharacterized protein n=1 Tax=Podoviridae sp. ctrub15 TaxID=2826581 RepID=A0A8S5LUR5_9CAUD|nr:MAG TPA: hypothetical protein [Podoviridae sp. ctrub15]